MGESVKNRPDFENLEVYKLAELFANKIWHIVQNWDTFSKTTMGQQLVRSADSVCVNIAEGRGRHSYQDNQRFVRIAKGSLYETISWLRLAYARNLLTNEQVESLKPIINELPPKLNAYLKSIGNSNRLSKS